MNLGQWVFSQRRLFLLITILLTILGILSFIAVPKDEDPRLPDWFASIVVVLPGGDVELIDETISKPLNEKLKEIDELKKVETTSRASVSSTQIEIKDTVRNTKEVWDKVRRAIDEVRPNFPIGTMEPNLIENSNRLETIIYAVSGTEDLLVLKQAALKLKSHLINVNGTSKIILHGDPHEELQVQYEDQKILASGIGHGQIIQKIQQSNTGMPGGFVESGDSKYPILVKSRIQSPSDLKKLKLLQGSGDPVSFGEIAKIEKTPRRFENQAFWNGKPAVFVGVVAQSPIEIIEFGKRIRQQVSEFQKETKDSGITVSELSFNPERTSERLNDLGMNLFVGILTIGLILFFWMGWKISFIVSLFVPVISLVGFFVYSSTGGVLHQISLAAFVISLGQFIDNIIVIVEWMNNRIDDGKDTISVAIEAINTFKKPMFFATGTNISAFIPMLVSSGTTAEFTFAIPLVSIMTMIAAFILGLMVVPIIAAWLMQKPKLNNKDNSKPNRLISVIERFSNAVATRPLAWSLLTVIVVGVSSVGFLFVRKQFFPMADRNQVIVKIELPESSNVMATNREAKKLMNFLAEQSEVENFATFIGEQIPRFYYNVGLGSWGSNIAEMIIVTRNKSLNNQLIEKIGNFSEKNLNDVFVLPRNLEQGPPVLAPIEYRIFNESGIALNKATAEVQSTLSNQSMGQIKSKNNIGQPIENLIIESDLELLERFGMSEHQLAIAVLSGTSGLITGSFFEDGTTKDIKLLGQKITSLDELNQIPIRPSTFRNLKLGDVAEIKSVKKPAVIHRFNGERMSRVLGWPSQILAPQEFIQGNAEKIKSISEANQTKIKIGGEVEGSGDANLAILKSIPLGLFILIICLLIEFNSIRKMLIVLLSVPLVIAGVTPGLLIGNAAFGFMSLLGVLALVGIVVNNSILLIESIDENVSSGLPLKIAIVDALKSRTQPILLTAVTTIAGLLPMAFEESTLWPPLALAMISGLIGSTIITLVFIPSLYSICFGSESFFINAFNLKKWNHKKIQILTSLVVLFILTKSPTSQAREYSFLELIGSAKQNSISVQISESRIQEIQLQQQAQSRGAFFPKLGLQIESIENQKQLTQTNAFGTFNYGKQNQVLAGVQLTQPIFNKKEMFNQSEALEHYLEAAKIEKKGKSRTVQKALIKLAIQKRKVEEALSSLKRLERTLIQMEKDVKKFSNLGLLGSRDRLGIQIAKSNNLADQNRVLENLKSIEKAIQIYVPDFTNLIGEIEFKDSNDSNTTNVRYEQEALDSVIAAKESELRAITDEYWPTLEFNGKYLFADQGLLDQKDWTQLSLALKWNIFEGGVRSSLEGAKAKEIFRLRKEKELLSLQIEFERSEINAIEKDTSFRIRSAEQDLKLSEAARIEDRYNARAGRVRLKDWLESEILYEQKKLELAVLKLDKINVQYDDQFVKGFELD